MESKQFALFGAATVLLADYEQYNNTSCWNLAFEEDIGFNDSWTACWQGWLDYSSLALQ